jgi:hypothetical protein
MNKSFEPEAHDIGKLLDLQGTELGTIIKANNHVFLAPDSTPLDFAAQGLIPPARTNTTWLAALLHHRPPPKDLSAGPAAELDEEYRSEAMECADLSTKSSLPFSERATVFLMIVADHMGSATSRTISDRLKKQVQPALRNEQGRTGSEVSNIPRQLVRIWNESKKIEPKLPFRTKRDLQTLLDYVAASGSDFLERFEEQLKRLPEDKFPLMNLTSLHTHCQLVGKIYRLLDTYAQRIPESYELSLDGKKVRTVREAEQNWRLTFARCEVRSPHQPVRVGDLNVVRLRNETMRALTIDPQIADHVLLHTTDTLWCIFPGNKPEKIASDLHRFLKKFYDLGFDAEILSFSRQISEVQNIDPGFFLGRKVQELEDAARQWERIRRDGDTSKSGDARSRYTAISRQLATTYVVNSEQDSPDRRTTTIDPPICEVCQRAPGEEQTYRERERQVVDYLCSSCLFIRRSGERFHKLSQWGEDNLKVAWVRVLLDKKLMEDVIGELYFKHTDETFVNNLEIAKQIKEQFRNLGLLTDFVKDYFAFLRRFATEVFRKFGGPGDDSPAGQRNIELLDENFLELFVLRMDKSGVVEEILKTFVDLLRSQESGFPDCAERSPIKLRVSVSRAKYPFFEHWAFLRDNDGFLKLQVPGRVNLALNLGEYECLSACEVQGGVGMAFLHRLLAIESRTHSPIMVRAELAPDPSDLKVQREFKQRLIRLDATSALTIDKLLNYAKILDL